MEGARDRIAELIASLESKDGPGPSRVSSPGGERAGDDKQAARNRPRTYPYFRYLPYKVEDEAERQGNFEEILKHLYIAVEAGDFTPGAVHWTRELRNWLGLKFDPTKEQRLKMVKLYYELALAPGIDVTAAERFSSMFMVLTKCVHHIPLFLDQRLTSMKTKTLSPGWCRLDSRLETTFPGVEGLRTPIRVWNGPHDKHQTKLPHTHQIVYFCTALFRPSDHTSHVERIIALLQYIFHRGCICGGWTIKPTIIDCSCLSRRGPAITTAIPSNTLPPVVVDKSFKGVRYLLSRFVFEISS